MARRIIRLIRKKATQSGALSMALVVLFAAAIAAGCGEFGSVAGDDAKPQAKTSTDSGSAEGLVSNKPFDKAAQKAAGCTPIEREMTDYGNEHSTDPDEKLTFKDNPPTSGKHYQVPLAWGVYPKEQKTWFWVHNLEHGHIVMAHRGLSKSELDTLIKYRARAPYHLIITPREANPKTGVYYMAWRARLYCAKPSAEAIQFMIDEFLDRGPEKTPGDEAKARKEQDA